MLVLGHDEKREIVIVMEQKKKSPRKIRLNTMQIIALGFLGVIFLGGILLWLPVSNQKPVAFLDALFTSVSCVCVTGLLTVVPAEQFTVFGQGVLFLLIQIGGLGIIACTALFFLILKKKITMKGRIMIQQAYGLDTLSGLVVFIIRILKGTFLVEAVGAVLFSFQFIPEYGVVKGIAYSIFHSVSAFCNAGIDILGNSSFTEYVKSPIVNVTTMLLIILGGLGFPVWYDLVSSARRVVNEKKSVKDLFRRLSLQSKIVLTMTAGLLVAGTAFFFLMEGNNPETMGDLSVPQKIMASAFQSVTMRTAGFATVSQAQLEEGSRLFGCILMFIGGSPAGTAGGIKTTTAAMLLLTVICVLRGKKDTECYGRKLEESVVKSGITIALITFVFYFIGVIALTLLEPGKDVLNLMYEATSAIGTVGLSADLTPVLGRGSHIVLMFLMYIGRIGPLTMALVLAGKSNKGAQFRDLPEKKIMLG